MEHFFLKGMILSPQQGSLVGSALRCNTISNNDNKIKQRQRRTSTRPLSAYLLPFCRTRRAAIAQGQRQFADCCGEGRMTPTLTAAASHGRARFAFLLHWGEQHVFWASVNMEGKPKANAAAQNVMNIGLKHGVNICLKRSVTKNLTNCVRNA